MIGARGDILDQGVHELGPLIARKLDGGDGNDELGGRLGGTTILGGEGLESHVLDLGLDRGSDLLNPSPLYLAQGNQISGGESVLQGKTCGGSNMGLRGFVCQFLAEGSEITSLRDISNPVPSHIDMTHDSKREKKKEKKRRRRRTYKVGLGSVEELLFGVGTCRRIWRTRGKNIRSARVTIHE